MRRSKSADQATDRHVVAVSKAHYRGFEIFETAEGCSFILNSRQYDFTSLDEAASCIDFLYADAAQRVLSAGTKTDRPV